VPCLATYLIGYLASNTTVIASVSATTTGSTITTTTHGAMTASSTTHCSICIDLLILFLGIDLSLCNKKMRIQIMKCLRICLGSEGFHKWIELEVETREDISDDIHIVKMLAGCYHLISIAFHLGIIRNIA
jgi:hypothetical protein